MDLWTRLDDFLASHEVVIDRPKGSRHPAIPEIVYPLDYGYLRDTSGGDGDGIDVWRGSNAEPVLVAIICTADSRKSDAEVKLLVGCSEAEIEAVNRFHNNGLMSGLVVRRERG